MQCVCPQRLNLIEIQSPNFFQACLQHYYKSNVRKGVVEHQIWHMSVAVWSEHVVQTVCGVVWMVHNYIKLGQNNYPRVLIQLLTRKPVRMCLVIGPHLPL